MTHLLFGTDFSEASRAACAPVARLARALGATLTVAHVDELEAEPVYAPTDELRGYQDHLRSVRDEALQETRYTFQDLGLEAVEITLLSDPSGDSPSARLIEAALELEASLIVVAKQGVRLSDRLLLGSTSQRLVRHAPLPVLVMPAEGVAPSAFRRILMPTDFSAPSRAALTYVSALAQVLWRAPDAALDAAPPARLALMTVSQPPIFASATMDMPVLPPSAYEDALEVAALESLESFAAGLGEEARLELRASVAPSVAEAVVEAADAWEADLIALPAHGKSRFRSVLLGSTTQALLRLARRPVLVLPRAFTQSLAS